MSGLRTPLQCCRRSPARTLRIRFPGSGASGASGTIPAGYYRGQAGPPDRTAGGEEECPERSALAGAWGLSITDTSE